MKRPHIIRWALGFGIPPVISLTSLLPAQDPNPPGDPAIATLMQNGFIVDGLLNYTIKKDPNCRRDCEGTVIDLSTMTKVTGVHIGTITVSRGIARVRRVATYVDKHPRSMIIRTFNDMWEARRNEIYGTLLYTQQVPMTRGNPMAVHDWYDAGLRMVQPAYSSKIPLAPLRKKNKLAGGADEPRQGLTPLGRKVIAELAKLHVILDISHCSEQTTMDIIAMTDVPILANHANAKALTLAVRGPMLLGRNKSNGELLAIAKTGGVIGVTTIAWMLDRNGDTKATMGDFLAHVDYIVKLVGIDHVGISSDSRVDGWGVDDIHYSDALLASPNRWRILAQRLKDEYKYTPDMLRKVLGLNFKRVYEQVMPGAHPPQLSKASKLGLSFAESVYRGVAKPVYDVELQIFQGSDFVALRRWSGTKDTELNPGDLAPGRYRWRATAVSGDIQATSNWAQFEVQ